ncbi:MAG: hypothetical protein PF450_01195 [Bacteroidales bacterium]|jgi:hypothetical protein|nr:hypothetical protein [Bacteroidales bacterium]
MEYTESAIVLEKVSSLPNDEYGIEFKSNGKLTEWKNSGWCGTPPISYGEFEGSWEFKNDSVLSIESEYWGGTSIMEWEILELNNQTLKHLIIKSENLDEE